MPVATRGQTDVVSNPLKTGANPHRQDTMGWRLLFYVAMYNFANVANGLQNMRTDGDAWDGTRITRTALWEAAKDMSTSRRCSLMLVQI